MDKLAIVTRMVEFIMSRGLAHKQQDIAAEMRATPGNVSRALNGDPKALTDNFIRRLNEAYGNIFNIEWTKTGEGNMLDDRGANMFGDISVGDINNSSHVAVGHVNKVVDEAMMKAQEFTDKRHTAPLVPLAMMKRSSDLMEYLDKAEGAQRIYCGELDIDAWIYVNDEALLPEYAPTDILGIKGYEDCSTIIPDNLYVVNTRSNGVVIRYLKFDDNGDFLAYTRSETFQPFTIKRSDVIRVYRKIIMFRY